MSIIPRFSSTLKRLLDLSLYMLIALAVAVLAVIYAVYGGESESFGKWVGFVVNTCILFGYAVKTKWRHHRIHSFWICLAVLIALHLAVFLPILWKVRQWTVMWFLLMYPVEAPAIHVAIEWAVKSPLNKRRV